MIAGADLTKEALRIIAAAAPEPVARARSPRRSRAWASRRPTRLVARCCSRFDRAVECHRRGSAEAGQRRAGRGDVGDEPAGCQADPEGPQPQEVVRRAGSPTRRGRAVRLRFPPSARGGSVAKVEIGLGKSSRTRTGSTTSRSSRAGAPATPRMSTSRGRSTRSARPAAHGRGDGRRHLAHDGDEIGRLGGVGVLNLEGLWTRYDDPEPLFAEIAELSTEKATLRMQDIYSAPIKPELVVGEDQADPGQAGSCVRERHAAAHCEADRGDRGGRARSARDPGHRRVRRARVEDSRAAEPQALRPRARHPDDRRRVCLLSGGACT